MKEQLQEIQNSINNLFEYNLETYKKYRTHVESALGFIKSIPDSNNTTLKSWKDLAMDELQKELSGRLSDTFVHLTPEEQKSELKFSKMAVSVVLMNIIMHL
jgi:hypothetical protein